MKKKKAVKKVRKVKAMARPKGSKNKKKEFIGDGGNSLPEVYVAPEVEIEKEADEIIEKVLVDKKVEVSPDAICLCEHKKQMHYGGENGWCNTEGCSCQTFR